MTEEKTNVHQLEVRKVAPHENALTLVPVPPCRHWHLEVDESRETLRCLDCNASIQPMWALVRMAREESLWNYKRERFIETKQKLEARCRTTCEHCGRMTRIRGI